MRLQTRMILMFSMLFTIGFLMLISSASKTVERANGKWWILFQHSPLNSKLKR